MTIETPQAAATITGAASELDDGLERMFRVVKTDHPDLVGGIVWADCELAWINERITLAILAEREACAALVESRADPVQEWGALHRAASAIRMRSNAELTGADRRPG